ncbi:MOSC domain-containing protein [Pseudoprimorskyibacter insulae]|uniref:Metal-sulfur cluster biosynthesis proteins YuaD n=1 Tax=Pseudoprimorskyibacter insulae TaxID=1695997 RepID=A0A2R8AVC3_9RHOB|nr:MOSC domain-containing protein [Pseudoprimorskyibacter insulae]SPF79985.1 Putative metal-sulfur cluster biosynthesis proteins YuaD [Pseudoprimorskyibacter insulae]
MPALKPTNFQARIVWMGTVPLEGQGIRSSASGALDLTFEGIPGERHSGLTRPSCSRVLSQHPRHTPIANARQLSIVSREELDLIARDMGLDDIRPEWVGATLVLEGIPDFTYIPPSSRLQAESGATLVIDMENRPCVLPGKEIEQDAPGFGAKFKAAARNRRGVTASVEREGRIRMGDTLRLHIPDQRAWSHVLQARSES